MDLLKAVVFTVDTSELKNVTTGRAHEILQRGFSLELTKTIIFAPAVGNIPVGRGYTAVESVFLVEQKQNDNKKH
jgi:hypothetical protein